MLDENSKASDWIIKNDLICMLPKLMHKKKESNNAFLLWIIDMNNESKEKKFNFLWKDVETILKCQGE